MDTDRRSRRPVSVWRESVMTAIEEIVMASWCRGFAASAVAHGQVDREAAEQVLKEIARGHWLAPAIPDAYFRLGDDSAVATELRRRVASGRNAQRIQPFLEIYEHARGFDCR
jgi:uncharacterized protein YcbX